MNLKARSELQKRKEKEKAKPSRSVLWVHGGLTDCSVVCLPYMGWGWIRVFING